MTTEEWYQQIRVLRQLGREEQVEFGIIDSIFGD